jgi:voltage-gated potassium channel
MSHLPPPSLAASHPFKSRLFEVIFEADTRAGKAFDVALLIVILASIVVVMLETVASIELHYGLALFVAEWIFTVLFTIEYVLRIVAVDRPKSYIFSFFGVVDLLAILPTYLSLLVPGSQSLMAIRSFRLIRVFRIFKLGRYLKEASTFRQILIDSRPKIVVFVTAVLVTVVFVGAAMHLIEGPENGFTSVPQAMYWAVVTMTTVGYGDIAPHTVLGKVIASMLMVVGYSLIVVPTGILSTSAARASMGRSAAATVVTTRACHSCSAEGHSAQAKHCFQCGAEL